MTEKITYLSGTVLDEQTLCNLADLCRLCGVSADFILEMIEEGVIIPSGRTPREWQFTSIEIRRVHKTIRLQNDLRVNLPGCALALDLIEELEELRSRLG